MDSAVSVFNSTFICIYSNICIFWDDSFCVILHKLNKNAGEHRCASPRWGCLKHSPHSSHIFFPITMTRAIYAFAYSSPELCVITHVVALHKRKCFLGGGLWSLEGCQLTWGDRHRLRMSTGYHRDHFSHSSAKYDAAAFVNKSKYIGQSFISVN